MTTVFRFDVKLYKLTSLAFLLRDGTFAPACHAFWNVILTVNNSSNSFCAVPVSRKFSQCKSRTHLLTENRTAFHYFF